MVTTATATINRMDTSVDAMLDTRESIAKLVLVHTFSGGFHNRSAQYCRRIECSITPRDITAFCISVLVV